jgi:hypothetical protein
VLIFYFRERNRFNELKKSYNIELPIPTQKNISHSIPKLEKSITSSLQKKLISTSVSPPKMDTQIKLYPTSNTPRLEHQRVRVRVRYTALRAIYEVRQSAQNFHIMEESGRIVDLMGIPISNAYPTNPHYLLEETQKASLGDSWRSLRFRPAKTAIKSSYPDVEYIPNNTYSYFQVKKTLSQSSNLADTGTNFQRKA